MREYWVEVNLDEIGNIVSGGTPKTSIKEYWGGNISWITPADLSSYNNKYISKGRKSITALGLEKSSAKLMPKGSILFSSRAPIGYTAIAKCDLSTNQGFKSVTPYKGVESLFIYFYFKASKQLAVKNSSGTTFKEISKKSFSELPVPLPPLPEQRAIVAKLEELFSDLDNGIANLKKAQAQLKVYRQAVLKKAFEGELTKEWRAKQTDLPSAEELLEKIKTERENHYQQQLNDWKQEIKQWEENGKEGKKPRKPSKFKEIPLFEKQEVETFTKLPKSWKWVRFSNVGFWTGGGTPSKSIKKFWSNGSVLWISPKDMKSKFIDNTIDKITYDAVDNSSAKFIESKSIVYVVRSGILRRILPVALTKERSTVNQDIQGLTPYLVNPEFIYWYSISNEFSIRQTCAKDGTTVESIETTLLKNYPFTLCSLEEQHQIVQEIESRLSVCDKMEESIAESLEKAEALRQSILKKAFEGKLLTETELQACRQQPDWEPAAKLLERIKGEKDL
jgi:type I restriction enzyme S subunit